MSGDSQREQRIVAPPARQKILRAEAETQRRKLEAENGGDQQRNENGQRDQRVSKTSAWKIDSVQMNSILETT